MHNARVLIGAPLSNETTRLEAYIQAIAALAYPKELISLCWLVNNCEDTTYQMLLRLIAEKLDFTEYNKIIVELNNEWKIIQDTHKREYAYRFGRTKESLGTCDLMAWGKTWLKTCIKNENKVLYLEGDILIATDTLTKLLARDKEVVGALCQTGVGAYNFLYQDATGWTRDCGKYPSGLEKVDYVSGPVLFDADLFKQLPFVKTIGVGEDATAMLYCERSGIARWVDGNARVQHDKWVIKDGNC